MSVIYNVSFFPNDLFFLSFFRIGGYMVILYFLLLLTDSAYDYAVPETGTMPLLSPDIREPPPSATSCNNSLIADKESLFSRSYSSDENKNKKVIIFIG